MSRREHFHMGTGRARPNHLVGWSTDDATVCTDCAQTDPELASIPLEEAMPIFRRDVSATGGLPDGFDCQSCGKLVMPLSQRQYWNHPKR